MGTSSNNKESVIDVLSRMKSELKFDVENYTDSGSPSPSAAPSASASPSPTANGDASTKLASAAAMAAVKTPKAPAPPVQDPTPSETVDELTNYMGNLLSRYGKGSLTPSEETAPVGDANAYVESHLPQRKPKSVEAVPQPNSDPSLDGAVGNAESSGDLHPAELGLLQQRDFVPRKRVPEEKASLDVMRELAVHSALKAIQVCDNKKRGFDAKHRLILGFGAFAISVVAFIFAETSFSLLGCVAMCGVATGCMFFFNWQKTVALVKKSNAS